MTVRVVRARRLPFLLVVRHVYTRVSDVRAASVNFPDTLIIRGQYQYKPNLPFVPGNECAGVVVEVGGSVDGLSVGDRVLALVGTGAYGSVAEACRNSACLAANRFAASWAGGLSERWAFSWASDTSSVNSPS